MKHIKPLTSLRFLFALSVFFHHTVFFLPDGNDFINQFYKKFFFEGFIGVNFFFILSGFILTYVYKDIFINNSISKKTFYIRRFARIYPLHLLLLLIAILFSFSLLRDNFILWLRTFTENIFLVQSFVPIRDHYFSFNIVSWSISDEMFFYLLFPFIIKPLSRLKVKASIVYAITAIGVLVVLMQLVPADYHHAVFYINPITRMIDFSLGIILFNVSLNIKFNKRGEATIWEIISLVLILIQYVFAARIPIVYRSSIYYWIAISLLILVFSKSEGIISKLMSKKYMVYLGHISFSFYLFHYIIIKLTARVFTHFGYDQYYTTAVTLSLVLSIMTSIISYEFFEKKIQSRILKVLKKS